MFTIQPIVKTSCPLGINRLNAMNINANLIIISFSCLTHTSGRRRFLTRHRISSNFQIEVCFFPRHRFTAAHLLTNSLFLLPLLNAKKKDSQNQQPNRRRRFQIQIKYR